jgi:PPK2 family polyphosphate:nucleotide phosphotransferase
MPIIDKALRECLLVAPGKKVSLKNDFDPALNVARMSKEKAREKLRASVETLAHFQDMLYAQNTYSLLVIFQALDAAGKDSTIKHVMSGINPQGCQVYSFKAPSSEELDHDYLWRCAVRLPERGRIGIFNRSYYEEVLVTRVHPELLERQQLPPFSLKDIWKQRFEEINNFEKYLVNNGILVLKFFLNVSKEEQKQRFLDRITKSKKNWKFEVADVSERQHWGEYIKAYEDCFQHTSTEWAPWYVIPADDKPSMRLLVSNIIGDTLAGLDLQYPVLNEERKASLANAKATLDAEEQK